MGDDKDTSIGRDIAYDHFKGGASPSDARDAINDAVRGENISVVNNDSSDTSGDAGGSDGGPWIP